MRAPRVLALLLAAAALAAPALAEDAVPPVVPGPLRGGPPPLPTQPDPKRPPQTAAPRVDPAARPLVPTVAAPPPRVWSAPLPAGFAKPVAEDAKTKGKGKADARAKLDTRPRVVADVATHDLRITGLVLDDAPGLEVLLVAGDVAATTSTEAVLAAKRVSLGRFKKPRGGVQLWRIPPELDLSVYRSLVVWSRRDKAPRLVVRLAPGV